MSADLICPHCHGVGEHNAALIAALRNAYPALAAEVRALRAALTEARDLLLERAQGSPSRSAAHNARLVIEAALKEPT